MCTKNQGLLRIYKEKARKYYKSGTAFVTVPLGKNGRLLAKNDHSFFFLFGKLASSHSSNSTRVILPSEHSSRFVIAWYFHFLKSEVNKKVCGNCYNYEYDGYVFVDELGDLMRPEYLTSYFTQYIQKHGCKRMRFHDLRHSCASLLLANGVPLKQIQDWLGHSDFSTTANIYAHLDYSSKLSSAQAIVSGMTLLETVDFGSKWETAAKKYRE